MHQRGSLHVHMDLSVPNNIRIISHLTSPGSVTLCAVPAAVLWTVRLHRPPPGGRCSFQTIGCASRACCCCCCIMPPECIGCGLPCGHRIVCFFWHSATCASCDRLSSCCLVVTPFASQSVDQLNEYRCRVRAASRIWVRCRSLAWTSCAWKYGCRRDMLSLSGSECLAVNLFTFRSLNDTACKIACRLLRLEALHAQHRRLRLAYHRAGLGETWH